MKKEYKIGQIYSYTFQLDLSEISFIITKVCLDCINVKIVKGDWCGRLEKFKINSPMDDYCTLINDNIEVNKVLYLNKQET